MLKRQKYAKADLDEKAAASVRLCVETSLPPLLDCDQGAAASVRLCVETAIVSTNESLCSGSRLRAAVC